MMNLFSGKSTGRIFIGRIGTSLDGMENIRIDRGHSCLGNKFSFKDECYRDRCCDWYEEWLKETFIDVWDEVSYELFRITSLLESGKDVNLQCWCSPKRCHGEAIKKIIYKYMNGRNL
jgi:hypothetical protein